MRLTGSWIGIIFFIVVNFALIAVLSPDFVTGLPRRDAVIAGQFLGRAVDGGVEVEDGLRGARRRVMAMGRAGPGDRVRIGRAGRRCPFARQGGCRGT